ncbi:uncharacterized protein LY89DRAFT_738191 [Mollisia scopiformis]|uniref:Amidohydrolase-related domain-containing protein n=1 Tax=Mollisia scopiformis TaxID=149040 RepID=A0A194WWP8_MOLSC|nr:uncharacterized protein LY89DRAFT_738191 [Mollisia scopiformis]KUJ12401.1 hypothetical protein LY89DRAFT_738191 [Mollisia scopiformis]
MSQNAESSTSTEDWRLPRGSWDTHVHVFDPKSYPYSPKRAYSPREASFQQLTSFGESLTTDNSVPNMVLVLPSPYGNLNESILDLLRKGESGGRLRGIVVLEKEQMVKESLLEMDKLGVRGVRLNMVSSGGSVTGEALRKAMTETASLIKDAGLGSKWWVQLFIPGHFWDELADTVKILGVRIIADHLGGMKGSSMLLEGTPVTSQPGFNALIGLASAKHLVVKISGFPRASEKEEQAYPDLEKVVRRFAAEVPDQLIWASDWPHTGEAKDRKGRSLDIPEPFRDIDDTAILRRIRSWVSDGVWEKMMVNTPEKMYI